MIQGTLVSLLACFDIRTIYLIAIWSAEQYALYRKLSKQPGRDSSSQPRPPSSISTGSTSLASRAGSSRTTPRLIPNNDYPTTPTPPARSRSGSSYMNAATTQKEEKPVSSRAGPLFPMEGSEAESSRGTQTTDARVPSGSISQPMFITPKKPRPYSGFIEDPNPVNPFAVSPLKPSPSALASPSNTVAKGPKLDTTSPFIHATSPRKLKQVLEANSLRKVKQRELDGSVPEVTPRTRARKRLRGEVVADTPAKDRPPRKRRVRAGEGNIESLDMELSNQVKGKAAMLVEDEEDDGFGPSPVKLDVSRSKFTELFDGQEGESSTDVRVNNARKPFRGRPSEMLGVFKKAAQTGTLPGLSTTGVAEALGPDAIPTSDQAPPGFPSPEHRSDEINRAEDDRLPTPPPDPAFDQPVPTPSKVKRQPRIISVSDDEQDEWDPEGGHVRHQLFITGTRRAIRKARGSLSDEVESVPEHQAEGDDYDGETDDEDGHQDREPMQLEPHPVDNAEPEDHGPVIDVPTPDLEGGGTTSTSAHTSGLPSSPNASTLVPPLLSLLSIQSPKASLNKMHSLRVKAIFDPIEAARLRTLQRGQDVYISGEGVDGDDVDEWDVHAEREEEHFGDDDWEEECDGWKAVGQSMDDEPW